jgi:hypothetical protein
MGFQCVATMGCRTPAGTITSITGTYEHDSLAEYDFVVPANTTDQQCQAAFPYANIKLASISASGAVTIETNSSSAPDDTISLTSTILAKMWTHDGKAGNLAANPFSANVDTLYITNATNAEVTVKIRVLYDGTP